MESYCFNVAAHLLGHMSAMAFVLGAACMGLSLGLYRLGARYV